MIDDTTKQARTAYEAFRGGLLPLDADVPRWEDAPSWIRDVAVVTYLQGKLDAGRIEMTDDKAERSGISRMPWANPVPDKLTERVAWAIQQMRFGRVLRYLSEIDIDMARAAIEEYEAARAENAGFDPKKWEEVRPNTWMLRQDPKSDEICLQGVQVAAPQPAPDDFHPLNCMPSCMMPDGGDACAGYAALFDAYWKLRHAIKDKP